LRSSARLCRSTGVIRHRYGRRWAARLGGMSGIRKPRSVAQNAMSSTLRPTLKVPPCRVDAG
jgi:hypothetical protein